MSEELDDIDWELANSFDPLTLPASDRISVFVHYGRDRVLEFVAESTSYAEKLPASTVRVQDVEVGWRDLGQPITRKTARPQQLEDPDFLEALAAQMAAAPFAVHRPTESTRIDIDIRQPGFVDRIFGARDIGGAWLPKLRDAVERKVREEASALLAVSDEVGPAP